jgi:uncharacterized protein (TIGR02265 family)
LGAPAPNRQVEPKTDQSVFEGLFTNVLKPKGLFAEDLVAVGYDPQRPERTYPTRIWIEAVKVACRHACPGMSEPEALNRLGRLYIGGYLDTIIGRLIGVSLQVLGPEMLIKRLPRWSAMGASGIEISVAQQAPGVWKATWKDTYPLAEFIAGVMQGGAARAGFTSVELAAKRVDGFDLIFHFGKKS